jgi:hypothetical protein
MAVVEVVVVMAREVTQSQTPATTPNAAYWCFLPDRSRTRAHYPERVTPKLGMYLDSLFHEFVIVLIRITMFSICIIMKILNSPIQWLERVICGGTEQAPMVVYEQATLSHGSYIVSLSTNVAGMREQRRGDTIVIYVYSSTVMLPRIVAANVVRKALIQIEPQTRHVFLDYSYFKIKALQHNKLPVTEMPKWISPSYELLIVCNYNLLVIFCICFYELYNNMLCFAC